MKPPLQDVAERSSRPSVDVRRWLRITSRTAHILAASVLVGGHYFSVPADSLRPWLYGVLGTGALLWATDLGQGWAYLREVRGLTVLVKIALVASVALLWPYRVAILFGVALLSGIVSHMPGRYRYYAIGKGPPEEPAETERAGLG
jgi:hypothetical protein